MSRVKVWPKAAGLEGFDAIGRRIKLRPGFPAYMDASMAREMESAGKVDLMAGKDPRELGAPIEDLDSVVDEEPFIMEKPKPRRGRPRKYARRDMQAEE